MSIVDFIDTIKRDKVKVVVVGDVMWDNYYPVKAKRISPEFPIKVMSQDGPGIETYPGGAGNVCNQMKHWNVEAYLCCVLDVEGKGALAEFNLNTDHCVTVEGWRLPRKNRFYDGDYPLERWDVESNNYFTPEWSAARKSILAGFALLIKKEKPGVAILSDYGKGLFVGGVENISREMIRLCNDAGVATVVDPKTVDKGFWEGCTIFKPNFAFAVPFFNRYCHAESQAEPELAAYGSVIYSSVKCRGLVLTDAGNGVFVQEGSEGRFVRSHELSDRRPVIRSVIGAGDNFCSFLAMATASKFPLMEAVKVAFNAASVFIEDKHTKPITPHQLHRWADPVRSKIVSLENLLAVRLQTPNQKWVMTNGCFDFGLTKGHVEYLLESKKKGDQLVVAVNSDDSVRLLKGEGRPIMPLGDRMLLLAALSCVDYVISFEDETPYKLVKIISPDLLVKGGDYKKKDVVGNDLVDVEIIPSFDSVTTTDKIKKYKDRLNPNNSVAPQGIL